MDDKNTTVSQIYHDCVLRDNQITKKWPFNFNSNFRFWSPVILVISKGRNPSSVILKTQHNITPPLHFQAKYYFFINIKVVFPVETTLEYKEAESKAVKTGEDVTLECRARGFPLNLEWKVRKNKDKKAKCFSKFYWINVWIIHLIFEVKHRL